MRKNRIIVFLLIVTQIYGTFNLSVNAKEVFLKRASIKSITNVDTTTQKIKWKTVKNASGYQLYIKKPGKGFKKLATLGARKKSYIVKGLITNKKYFYKIRVLKGSKKGKFSNIKGKKVTNFLVRLYKPYVVGTNSNFYIGNTFKMAGDSYTNGVTLIGQDALNSAETCIYNLHGKYKYMSFIVGHVDGSSDDVATLKIIADGDCVAAYEMKNNPLPEYKKIDIENALKLEIVVNGYGWTRLGIANVKLYK